MGGWVVGVGVHGRCRLTLVRCMREPATCPCVRRTRLHSRIDSLSGVVFLPLLDKRRFLDCRPTGRREQRAVRGLPVSDQGAGSIVDRTSISGPGAGHAWSDIIRAADALCLRFGRQNTRLFQFLGGSKRASGSESRRVIRCVAKSASPRNGVISVGGRSRRNAYFPRLRSYRTWSCYGTG